jgi:hypothetical protein
MSQTSNTNLIAVTPLVWVYDKHSASSELVHQGQRMQQVPQLDPYVLDNGSHQLRES